MWFWRALLTIETLLEIVIYAVVIYFEFYPSHEEFQDQRDWEERMTNHKPSKLTIGAAIVVIISAVIKYIACMKLLSMFS